MVALLFFIGIMMGALGGVLLKMGVSNIGSTQVGSVAQGFQFVISMFTNLQVLTGMALYFLSVVIWAYLLTKLDISFVQPILALTYVVTPILAIFMLHEQVPPNRWLGIAVIIIGVYIVARTAS